MPKRDDKPGFLFTPGKRQWISGLPVGTEFQTRRLGKVRAAEGDLLYHREPLWMGAYNDDSIGACYLDSHVVGEWAIPVIPELEWRWQRSTLTQMYMPRDAARLWYRVVSVRRERLREISDEDALAEGIKRHLAPQCSACYSWPEEDQFWDDPAKAFFALWDSINAAKAPAESNPTVSVYTLRIERRK